MVDGIEINKKDAEDSLLPEDLNSLAVGSYVVPNPSRRKYYPAYILSVCALFLIASYFLKSFAKTHLSFDANRGRGIPCHFLHINNKRRI